MLHAGRWSSWPGMTGPLPPGATSPGAALAPLTQPAGVAAQRSPSMIASILLKQHVYRSVDLFTTLGVLKAGYPARSAASQAGPPGKPVHGVIKPFTSTFGLHPSNCNRQACCLGGSTQTHAWRSPVQQSVRHLVFRLRHSSLAEGTCRGSTARHSWCSFPSVSVLAPRQTWGPFRRAQAGARAFAPRARLARAPCRGFTHASTAATAAA